MPSELAAGVWGRRNVQALTIFAPLLLLAGVLGFVTPPELSLMSGAVPYNIFHLIAGSFGLVVALRRSVAACALFNLVFGAIDLWQFVAGLTGLFPAHLFALRPADHIVHLLFGAGLVAIGYLGRRAA